MTNLWNAAISGVGLVVAAVAIFLALDARSDRPAGVASAAPVRAPELDDVRAEIRALREEARLLRAEVKATRGAEPAVPEAEPSGPEATPARPDPDALLALGRKILKQEATPEESARFWKEVRSPGAVDDLLAKIEAEVAAAPTDVDARMRLADAYVLKLFTVPAGPEMGHWGGKAEGEWREVLTLEPAHWQARFNLAVSLSYHPDVLTKTPESIRELTRLVEQQEDMTVEPRQADVYRLLAVLHRRQGDPDAAARALRSGLERHPDDEKLRKAVEALEDRDEQRDD